MNSPRLFLLLSFLICSFARSAEELIAVTIALTAQDSVLTESLERNKLLGANNTSTFAFDGTHRPHVTILQMYLSARDLKKLSELMKDNLPKPLTLDPSTIDSDAIEKDQALKLVSQYFKRNDELQSFQALLLKRVEPLMKTGGSSAAFYEKQAVDSQYIRYVSSFAQKNTGPNFKPHLTLGISKGGPHLRPMGRASFSRLSIYQLGNFGTARKELARFDLR